MDRREFLKSAVVAGLAVNGAVARAAAKGEPDDQRKTGRRVSGWPVSAGRTEPFLMSKQCLAETKARIYSGDESVLSAFSALLRNAEKSMLVGPFTVMAKKKTPPSGDKHDYMSIGSYWWPDEHKEDGLPYIRRDGERNPDALSDDYDERSLTSLVTAVETLALAYYFSEDEKYARRAALLLRTWFVDPDTRMNPNLEYAQAIAGITTGRGIGIIDTAGLARIVDAAIILENSPAFTRDDHAALTTWFSAYLKWLLESKNGRDENAALNNHGTWYDVQVVAFALFVGRKSLARKVLESAKLKRMDAQIEPDGSQPMELDRTRAFSYCIFNLVGLFALARLGESAGVDLWTYPAADRPLLRAALDFIAPYADPTLKWPHRQITTFERGEMLPLLLQAAKIYPSQKYPDVVSRMAQEDVTSSRTRLLYPTADHKLEKDAAGKKLRQTGPDEAK